MSQRRKVPTNCIWLSALLRECHFNSPTRPSRAAIAYIDYPPIRIESPSHQVKNSHAHQHAELAASVLSRHRCSAYVDWVRNARNSWQSLRVPRDPIDIDPF